MKLIIRVQGTPMQRECSQAHYPDPDGEQHEGHRRALCGRHLMHGRWEVRDVNIPPPICADCDWRRRVGPVARPQTRKEREQGRMAEWNAAMSEGRR